MKKDPILFTPKAINELLSAEVSARFEYVGGRRSSSTIYMAKYGTFDFTKITVAQAERLVKMEAPFLKAKGENPKQQSSTKTSEKNS